MNKVRNKQLGLTSILVMICFCILHSAAFSQNQDDVSLARDFVRSREARLEHQTLRERVINIRYLAFAAYQGGDSEKATEFAIRLQRDVEELNGKSVSSALDGLHASNTVLGLIALDKGRIDEANAHLLASGKLTNGSPTLETFGPAMMLAKRLLDKGQRETVLQYLNLCSAFWTHDQGNLAKWKSAINSGGTPDFGVKLTTGYDTWKFTN